MRLVNYKVRDAHGNEFETTKYSVAKKEGNTIVKTFLTVVDETTEKEKDLAKRHAEKVREVYKKKRG